MEENSGKYHHRADHIPAFPTWRMMTFNLPQATGDDEGHPRSGDINGMADGVLDNDTHPYAHSLPGLIRQCLAKGYSRQDIIEMHTAFGIAAELHGSSFRPSKKTFIEHLVRTASILLVHGGPPELVNAALLHAVYLENSLSTKHLTCTDRNQSLLKELVGIKVEAVIRAYYLARPSKDCKDNEKVPRSDLQPIDYVKASVVRIANGIEDLLENATLLEQKSLRIFHEDLGRHGPAAAAYGYRIMVAELAARIRIAEAAMEEESADTLAAAWLFQLIHKPTPRPLPNSTSLAIRTRQGLAMVLRKMPWIKLPMPVKKASKTAQIGCGLILAKLRIFRSP